MQQHFELIPHVVEREIVQQRVKDGYINATAMCQATGKRFHDYVRIGPTQAFLTALSTETGIPVPKLVQTLNGGDVRLQGTWVHPQVAINLATWCSATFAVQVSKWVYDWMSGRAAIRPTVLYHLRRYATNHPNVPAGHFSVLVEMTQLLIAPMELMGYTLPERMLPDISQGKMFCSWLRDEMDVDTDALPKYRHDFEDGRTVWPKAYPDELLAAFRRHFWNTWLPEKAVPYFSGKDSAALEYLPRLLAKATVKAISPNKPVLCKSPPKKRSA